ncbi:uncharacterized protein MKS88_000217 [Plasmodium brasilianum]|uniref:uncharacterized protein n=1 Tax=Plasmodium brasilianum TaxID=5824 RepID=UPI00350E53D7|nr:hypothetical protein MKS88_000217 [Plasmodium brasilianum]
MYCNISKHRFLTSDNTFITYCQDIGRYLIQIKDIYNPDSSKLCRVTTSCLMEIVVIILKNVMNIIIITRNSTPTKLWLRSHLKKKKIIEINKVQKERRESLKIIHEEVNRNYDGSIHNIGYHPQ